MKKYLLEEHALFLQLRYRINFGVRLLNEQGRKYHSRPSLAMELSVLRFNVNGKDISAENIDPEITLASYLRNQLGLTGTKLACEEGVCGSCTVVIGKWDHKSEKARTVLHEATARSYIFGAEYEMRRSYSPFGLYEVMIIPTTHSLVVEQEEYLYLNSNACPCKENGSNQNGNNTDHEKLITFDDFPKLDETQEILFPPSLIIEKPANTLYLEGSRVKLVAPVSWKQFDECFNVDDE
ncbi:2Fe-2S iron-sulfur cluster binding domain protein, partial [Teladorsagia circumcincta]